MHLNRSKQLVARLLIAASLAAVSGTALAQMGTAITYQGVLERNGMKVNTATDMRFTLYDAAAGGNTVGNQVVLDGVNVVQVSNGLFAVPLDFGMNPYSADRALWLQIEVRNPAGTGVFVPMGARQRITPSPFSLATRGINVGATGNVAIGGPLFPNADFTINGNGDNANLFLKATPQGFGWNLGTDGPALFFNTSNGQGSSVNMVTMKDNGNVGIGTDVPAQRLDVRGQLQVANSIRLDQGNEPMIVRQNDPFTSGAKAGFGRWGMFKESRNLFLGVPTTTIPNIANSIGFGGWLNDGTRQDWMTIVANGSVGIGTSAPTARLQLGSNQIPDLTSPHFTVNCGALGPNALDEIAMGHFTYTIPGFNSVGLGVRARQNASRPGWTGTSVSLGLDVDSTVRAGGSLWFNANGIGINVAEPVTTFDVNGAFTIRTPQRLFFGLETENTDPIYFERQNYGVDQTALVMVLGDQPNSGDDVFHILTRNVGGGGDSIRFGFQASGVACKVGDPAWCMISDARLKHDVQPLANSLDRVLQLHGKTFYYNDPNALGAAPGLRTGFVAQEVEMVFPNWVGEKDGFKTLTISGFEALTVESLRELRAEKDAQIAELKAQNAELSARLERIEALLGQAIAK